MKAFLSGLASGLTLLSLFGNHVGFASSQKLLKSKENHRRGHNHQTKRQTAGGGCGLPAAQQIQAPRANVWGGLTTQDGVEITSWLHQQQEFNLTVDAAIVGEWDNVILLIEQMIPNKTDVLAFLDENGQAPQRYARVIMDIRATLDPYYQELIVGPLPVNPGYTRYAPLTYPYTKKSSGRIRSLDTITNSETHQNWVYAITSSLGDVFQEILGGPVTGNADDAALLKLQDPLWQDDGIIHWYSFFGYPKDLYGEDTLLPSGLYLCANVTGRDPRMWTIQGWLYNNIFYPTTDEFRNAVLSPGFQKLPIPQTGPWATTDHQGKFPPLDNFAPPMATLPGGSRYFVDEAQKYVRWMDFEFYIAFTRDTGMRLFDIRYKGQRIIYELGLEEALAHYAGNDPFQSSVTYLDSWYGFGTFSLQLVPGYDCPTHATYLNSEYYDAETIHQHQGSICMFETTADYPMQRHMSPYRVSVTKNIYFTVRTVATLGNYDYMISYSFHMDGSVKVEVRASGYIQGAYYAYNGDYGNQIHDVLSGSVHDHVINFKIDIDVLGTANTLTTTTLVPTTEKYPWAARPRNTMKLQRGTVTNENEGRLNWAPNDATAFTVVNSQQPNPYGVPRGYRIMPSSGAIHLTVKDSSNLVNAANWATNDLSVTKQKDSEPRSAYPWNNQDTHDPMIDFNNFFDGENLVQEDLVLWVNLGMHHIPHTGDIPNTVFTTAHSGLTIMPVNYLPNDPGRDTVNMVRIDYSGGNTTYVETFGQGQATCVANLGAMQPDLYKYSADVVTRKYPFDPAHPFLQVPT